MAEIARSQGGPYNATHAHLSWKERSSERRGSPGSYTDRPLACREGIHASYLLKSCNRQTCVAVCVSCDRATAIAAGSRALTTVGRPGPRPASSGKSKGSVRWGERFCLKVRATREQPLTRDWTRARVGAETTYVTNETRGDIVSFVTRHTYIRSEAHTVVSTVGTRAATRSHHVRCRQACASSPH